jgi:4-amino-4-deoxy-L-arabinose transferase-like glycosyltransferase
MDRMRRDSLLLTRITAVISFGALIFYYHQGALLLYGDAVAHINIARRVFDSQTPSLLQLGTVWLPLPHLLDIPFIVNNRLWQTGLGASVPSMIAYVIGTLGVFRLVRGLASCSTAWIAAAVYALNPNLIYMQATAMTESLYLAFFIWASVYFTEFVSAVREAPDEARKLGVPDKVGKSVAPNKARQSQAQLAARKLVEPNKARQSLERCGLMIGGAMLVRYDGWFLAAIIGGAAFIILLRQRQSNWQIWRGFVNLCLFVVLIATLFLVYNYYAFGNALEFANGPNSARAIQERSRTATMPTYPGEHSLRDATLQFFKTAQLNMAEGSQERWLFAIALVAVLASVYFARRYLRWSILLVPVPFYILCIAWGSVPIYHPEWWPFSYYNVRYGLQLLPAVAVFFALACGFAANFFSARRVGLAAVVLIAASYFSIWYHTPVCLREAQVNGRDQLALEQELAAKLKALPQSATLMMDCSAHPGALQMAGIPFKRVLRESNHPAWQIGLSQPARSADFLIAFPHDDVSRAVRLFPQGLELVATIGTPSQPKALIYRSRH